MQSVLDTGFKKYGRVIADIDTSEIVKLMDSYDMPEDVVYVAGDEKLENTQIHKVMEESVYGGCHVQTGYCNGHNQKLNALEYHRSSEVNIAATDMILLLGSGGNNVLTKGVAKWLLKQGVNALCIGPESGLGYHSFPLESV